MSTDESRRESYAFLRAGIKLSPPIRQIWNTYFESLPLIVELCCSNSGKESHLYISKTMPAVQNLDMRSIAVPISSTIYRDTAEGAEAIFFKEFIDHVDVLPSLQRPKRITVLCSDGVRRRFLFKPKDDLRKDMRFLELAVMVNKLFAKHGQIKVYAALPLNEDAGVIEWVDQTCSLRSILSKLYKSHGIPMQYPEFRELQKSSTFTSMFVRKILPKYQPQLPYWFMTQFSEAESWFIARRNFVHTSSTISIFGHIMGLGDRHCENIMLCEATGETMHVDFNCLFERGKLLAVPERVPFRLTQNITAAFGACGYNGEFHSQCVNVLQSLKSNQQMMMANMEAMVNDPTSDFSLVSMDLMAVIGLIKNKLSGLEDGTVFRSDSGQVLHLIEEATNPDNLSKMYVGWAPFL